MNRWKDTFLTRLFRTDKAVFVVVMIYLAGIAYGWRLDREEFPFLLYGMYSLKEEPKKSYNTYLIEANGKEIQQHWLLNPKKELMITTTAHVMELLDGGMSEKNNSAFGKWLVSYGARGEERTKKEMKVYQVSCRYDEKGKASVTSKEMVYSYEEERFPE